MIAEIILQIRLYALYLMDKRVLALMLVCFMASSVCAAVIMGNVLSGVTAIVPGRHFCVPLGISSHFYSFWIPILAFETLLCALALARGIQTVRSERGLFRFKRDLVNVFVRDSVLYFLAIFMTYLTNLLVLATRSQYVIEIPIAFTVCMSCVMGNRIILNVRGVKRYAVHVSPSQYQHAPASRVPLNFQQSEVSDEIEMWDFKAEGGRA